MSAGKWAEGISVDAPGVASARTVAIARRALHPLVRLLFRARLDGAEQLPESGPYLLVANHSGGLAIAEILSFVALWAARFGGGRPIAGFAHPFGFVVWPLSRVLALVGAIPSTYTAAHACLRAGVPILVFPGGDHEGMRPIWQAHRVDFAGRRGFLRIAREARVPVVPMGIRGSHFTAPILLRAKFLATLFVWPRLAGAKRAAVTVLGVLGAIAIARFVPIEWPWRALVAWAWLSSPLAMMPWLPWSIRMRVGRPLSPDELFGTGDREEDEGLARAFERVERHVQQLVKQSGGDPRT